MAARSWAVTRTTPTYGHPASSESTSNEAEETQRPRQEAPSRRRQPKGASRRRHDRLDAAEQSVGRRPGVRRTTIVPREEQPPRATRDEPVDDQGLPERDGDDVVLAKISWVDVPDLTDRAVRNEGSHAVAERAHLHTTVAFEGLSEQRDRDHDVTVAASAHAAVQPQEHPPACSAPWAVGPVGRRTPRFTAIGKSPRVVLTVVA